MFINSEYFLHEVNGDKTEAFIHAFYNLSERFKNMIILISKHIFFSLHLVLNI